MRINFLYKYKNSEYIFNIIIIYNQLIKDNNFLFNKILK